jgi:4a-hydroxytetrahydrobiopterin dehydratase
VPYAPLLGPQEVQERLKRLDGWALEGDRIVKRFSFRTFQDSMAFVNRVAELAEAADHHPDMAINYTRVTVSLTTYASKGLTHKDFDLAAEVEGVLSEFG